MCLLYALMGVVLATGWLVGLLVVGRTDQPVSLVTYSVASAVGVVAWVMARRALIRWTWRRGARLEGLKEEALRQAEPRTYFAGALYGWWSRGFRCHGPGLQSPRALVELDASGAIPASLRLSPGPRSRGEALDTGDRYFGSVARVAGDEAECLGALDARARERIVEAFRLGPLRVDEGVVRLGYPHRLHSSAGVRRRLRMLRDVVEALVVEPDEVPLRLARSAVSDPRFEVRERYFDVWLTAFPGREGFARACAEQMRTKDLLADPSATRVLRAAEAVLTGEGAKLDRLWALKAFELWADEADAVQRLTEALQSTFGEMSQAAGRGLARLGGPASVAPLRTVLAGPDSVALGTAIVSALRRAGGEQAEAGLRDALAVRDPATRLEAAKALGEVGTTDSVVALTEAAKRRFEDASVLDAIRRGIDRIQARAPRGGRGQLALVQREDGAGALALAQGGGGVSVAEPFDETLGEDGER